MDFDTTRLSAETIATLYPSQLVVLPQAETKPMVPAEASPKPSPQTNQMGSFANKILILVNEPVSPLVTDEQHTMLTRLFMAAKSDLTEARLVNMAGQPKLVYTDIVDTLQPRMVLLFDVGNKLLALPFVIPPYRIYQHGEIQYLHLPALHAFVGNSAEIKEQKKRLWQLIQHLFGLV